MRCPNCGSPVPLGSERCIDCGAHVASHIKEPWESGDNNSARRNTGERRYRRDQFRQRIHERQHTAESTSRESEEDFRRPGAHHSHPDEPRPTAAPAAPDRTNTPERPVGQPRARKKKKKGVLPIIIAIIVFFTVMDLFDSDSVEEDDVSDFLSAVDDFFSDDEDGTDTLTMGDTEYLDDGGYCYYWYYDDGTVGSVDYYDADDFLYDTVWYNEDGSLYSEETFTEDGFHTCLWYTDDQLSSYQSWQDYDGEELTIDLQYGLDGSEDFYSYSYTYYEDGAPCSELDLYRSIDDPDLYLYTEEYFYAEDGEVTGYVLRDEETGALLEFEGVDDSGTPLDDDSQLIGFRYEYSEDGGYQVAWLTQGGDAEYYDADGFLIGCLGGASSWGEDCFGNELH